MWLCISGWWESQLLLKWLPLLIITLILFFIFDYDTDRLLIAVFLCTTGPLLSVSSPSFIYLFYYLPPRIIPTFLKSTNITVPFFFFFSQLEGRYWFLPNPTVTHFSYTFISNIPINCMCISNPPITCLIGLAPSWSFQTLTMHDIFYFFS